MRSHAATIEGVFAIRSIAASASLVCAPFFAYGLKNAVAEIAVRSTSIGHAVFGVAFKIAINSGGNGRAADSFALSASSCACTGNSP